MIKNITPEQKTRLKGLFAAKLQATEEHKLTMQGYSEAFKDQAENLRIDLPVVNKAYSDFVYASNKPEERMERDQLLEEVFQI